jgi:hypothetical protein
MADAAPAHRSVWHLGSRVERVRNSHSYGVVLALVIAGFLVAAVAPAAAWSDSLMLLVQSTTLVVALWTAGLARGNSTLSLTLIAASVAVAVANIIWSGTDFSAASGLLAAGLVVATITSIAFGIGDQLEVSARSVLGAISIYILAGMLFTLAYGVLAALGSGPFFAQGTDGTRPVRLYFSFVTLATLGYGDYTTAGDLGHILSVVEALIGQLYLVTVVTVIVSRARFRR